MLDLHNRNIDYLRISITDRCNLRCVYCMPAQGIKSLPHEDILTFDEILRVCRAASVLGIRKIKITGGEPLVRTGTVELIRKIKALPLIDQVTLTTNGILLADVLEELKDAGLDGVNISLDTLNKKKFAAITRRDCLEQVLEGLDKALASGISDERFSVKINCLPAQEFNCDELPQFAAIARDKPVSVRFIELMPIGFGKQYHPIPNSEILSRIQSVYGTLHPVTKALGNGPAVYYHADGFRGNIGFISAVSNEFCSQCNRIRLTSEGFLKLCLHYNKGIDLKAPLRRGISQEELSVLMRDAILTKPLKHSFHEQNAALSAGFPDVEYKAMSQIGG